METATTTTSCPKSDGLKGSAGPEPRVLNAPVPRSKSAGTTHMGEIFQATVKKKRRKEMPGILFSVPSTPHNRVLCSARQGCFCVVTRGAPGHRVLPPLNLKMVIQGNFKDKQAASVHNWPTQLPTLGTESTCRSRLLQPPCLQPLCPP